MCTTLKAPDMTLAALDVQIRSGRQAIHHAPATWQEQRQNAVGQRRPGETTEQRTGSQWDVGDVQSAAGDPSSVRTFAPTSISGWELCSVPRQPDMLSNQLSHPWAADSSGRAQVGRDAAPAVQDAGHNLMNSAGMRTCWRAYVRTTTRCHRRQHFRDVVLSCHGGAELTFSERHQIWLFKRA